MQFRLFVAEPAHVAVPTAARLRGDDTVAGQQMAPLRGGFHWVQDYPDIPPAE
jgi:hypothetical protein